MGTPTRVLGLMYYPERDPELEEDCPGLLLTGYTIKSCKDPSYNCVAFALGDLTHYWYDVKVRGYYWPPGMPSADTVEGWTAVFAVHGYVETEDSGLEPDFEKVAIYVSAECPEHVARQIASGAWVSKMGKGYDIEHPTLEALESMRLGKLSKVMKRRCSGGRRVLE